MKTPLRTSVFKDLMKNENAVKVIENYPINPHEYVREYSIIVNGKKRKITAYQNNSNGHTLRWIHTLTAHVLFGLYQPSDASYAYHGGRNALSCVKKHQDNCSFLKSDISDYFNSIHFEQAKAVIQTYRPTFTRSHSFWDRIWRLCFFNDTLPLGFVTSPIISDLYLTDVDEKMREQTGIIYTRYADDFIISTDADEPVRMLETARSTLEALIKEKGLRLKDKKTYIRELKQEGDAIHLLGMNLVRGNERNYITISDKYIRETCFELCKLIKDKDILEMWEASRRFCSVNGKIQYIVNASGRSAEKLERMIFVKSGIHADFAYENMVKLCFKNPDAFYRYQTGIYRYKMQKSRMPLFKSYLAWENDYYDLSENGNGNGNRVNLKPIVNYLLYLLRSYEKAEETVITPICLRLTVDDRICCLNRKEDISNFRDLVKTIKNAENIVSYYGCYTVSETGEADGTRSFRMNRMKVFTDNSEVYRPMFIKHSGMDSCALFDLSKPDCLLGKGAAKKLLVSQELQRTDWRLSLRFRVSWPDMTADSHEIITKSLMLMKTIGIDPESQNNNGRTIAIHTNGAIISTDTVIQLISIVKDISGMIYDAEGGMRLDCLIFPQSLLEGAEESGIQCITASTSYAGKADFYLNTICRRTI